MSQRVSELFDVSYGNKLDLIMMEQTSICDETTANFVARGQKNNGVVARVKLLTETEPYQAGCITVTLGGSILETFVQTEPFYTAQNVAVLTARAPAMSLHEKLWWGMCIGANKYRYNYGRHANRTLKALPLPDTMPGWVANVTVDDLSAAREAAVAGKAPTLDVGSWQTFRYDELFDIKRGRYVPANQKKPGPSPTATSTATNNGIGAHTSLDAEHLAGCITVARNGSVGEAFYQPEAFFATDDVHVFSPVRELHESFTIEARLFVCALIRKEAYRYNYGRKWSLKGMNASRIKLPVTEDGQPDWQWMTDYMRALPFSSPLAPGVAAT